MNGSGVETLFGQLKHRTSGNLTGHSYESAKAVLLTRRQVVGTKPKDDYRDTPLTYGNHNSDGNQLLGNQLQKVVSVLKNER